MNKTQKINKNGNKNNQYVLISDSKMNLNMDIGTNKKKVTNANLGKGLKTIMRFVAV